MKKFFTSDWHLGSSYTLKHDERPFKDINQMNKKIIDGCNQRAKEGDIIYHIGDFLNTGVDRSFKCSDLKFNDYIKMINANMILLEGNHDTHNGVKCTGGLLFTSVGNYFVSIGHLPSDFDRSDKLSIYKNKINMDYLHYIGQNHIHICGHVHKDWRYHYDARRNILNINVGIDIWKYKIVSEVELYNYINKICINGFNNIICKSNFNLVGFSYS